MAGTGDLPPGGGTSAADIVAAAAVGDRCGGIPPLRRLLIELGVVALVSVAAAVILLQLWSADLRVPFDYGGDALWSGLVIRTTADHGWPALVNPRLGAPWALELHDFPQADHLHLLAIKV